MQFHLYTEDDDMTLAEPSTNDISSEDVVKKSYDSDYSEIGIVQTSEGSVNEVSILNKYSCKVNLVFQ